MLITARQVLALQKEHERQNFTCGSPALDRYLKSQARQDSDKRVAAVFALVQPPASQVLGYYTLSSSTIHADEVPPEIARKLPRHPKLPVTLLGRLAIDQGLKGQGMGQFLLMDALHRSLQAAVGIAAMAVVVDAKDALAADFYQHFGFIPLNQSISRLFLPMKTIATLFD
ncbi:MAG: GNAT family N-acetyltransferase [Rhodoferax sp.]|nr:GNAT family N-acetyltransferase [Rhodoferax sp.]NCP54862.1 GNAT family N-acetyltransferase [Rhodoferax sp.]PIW06819.1 MAG: GNAT family N-acetyltransferase [Comamonadaceae bacterium CG17_big_fil_post_rev_8_21_14_2_50_60_13]PIY24851.1 MAG: GNAT family N-acetyltransferase [Comamonadaceae bacterium CG_4_10_14_3_um_filter_60_75]PJC11904.1 MAG: GNAT family N-acetyltransferase [Comamonadaceae bacterium CG_4_9_14_0_8_um_filter_60_18]